MNLLDKYITEVGKHLPRRSRIDLQTEIRSTLEDMLDDLSRETGKPVDDEMVRNVLREYGSPSKVAEAYSPTRYLIGPRMYPFFVMVVKIVFTVLTVVSLVGLGVGWATTGGFGVAFLNALGKWFLEYLTGIISAFGNIVLVFAILERVLPSQELETEEFEKWSPADLEKEPDPDEAKRAELIFEILFTVIGLALFNLYPQLIGIAVMQDNTWIYLPALSEAFFTYLPYINILGLLQIFLDVFLIRQGSWQRWTRLAGLGLEIATFFLALIMLRGPSLLDTTGLTETPLAGATDVLIPLINSVPVIILVVVIIISGIEAVQHAWKLLNQRNAAKPFLPNS
jgi:hypothetical protein